MFERRLDQDERRRCMDMLTQPVTTPSKTLPVSPQARLPAEEAAHQQAVEEAGPEKDMKPEALDLLMEDVQKNMTLMHDVDLRFSVHQASGRVMITVTEGATGEVIREIPPSELLALATRLEEMIGVIFDQQG